MNVINNNGVFNESDTCGDEKINGQMATDRNSFSLNSIFPTSYRSKAEAFAKCLQDKLKSLGGSDDTKRTGDSLLTKYTDEEICDSVFLQGNLAYKTPSVTNGSGSESTVHNNGISKSYVRGVMDKRGFSSDSEDSDNEEEEDAPNVRKIRRLKFVDSEKSLVTTGSLESNSSWCSCEGDEEDEGAQLASQIKGSPPMKNSRKFVRKRHKPDKATENKSNSLGADERELFFDVDGLSPAEVESDEEDRHLQVKCDLEEEKSAQSTILANPEFSEEDNNKDDDKSGEERIREEKTEALKNEERVDESALEELAKKIQAVTCVIEFADNLKEENSSSSSSPKMKLRRCSSLKTWKTPPGTPGSKKIVRFADVLGLDLADVRTFLDEVPRVPSSAYRDLNIEVPKVPEVYSEPIVRTLIPIFQQPGIQLDFMDRVTRENVYLERAVLSDTSLLSIEGIVRVRNLSFNKSVHVRYSKDNWISFSDLQASYVPGSSDSFTDLFSFTLYGHTLSIGERIEFAIRFDCSAGTFWDSNGGVNYVFQCMPQHKVFAPIDHHEASVFY